MSLSILSLLGWLLNKKAARVEVNISLALLHWVWITFHPDLSSPPFPKIDIIRAVVIVWRVRGKTIRSVLCNIVCDNCAQCDAHTYEQTNSSLYWVLSHWAHFTVLRFIFMVALCNRADHYIFAL